MSRSAEPYRIEGDDLVLRVRVTPGARSEGFDGMADGPDGGRLLRLKVRAKAQDGAANAAVIAALAKAFDRPRSSITLESGMAARVKTLRLAGDAGKAAARAKELGTP